MADVGPAGLGLAAAPALNDEAVGRLDGESNLVSVDKNLLADVLPVDVWELVVDWPSAAAATRFVVCHGRSVLFCCGNVAKCVVVAYGYSSPSSVLLHIQYNGIFNSIVA